MIYERLRLRADHNGWPAVITNSNQSINNALSDTEQWLKQHDQHIGQDYVFVYSMTHELDKIICYHIRDPKTAVMFQLKFGIYPDANTWHGK